MSFDHPGLLYEGVEDYLTATTKFVRGAVAAGDAVLVAVPGPNLTALRDSLSDVAASVDFADMTVAGRNPGRIIPGVLLAFAATHAGRRVSIIGEPIWPGRSAVEYPACAQHEALINAVFTGRDAAILCPYDAGRLDAAAVRDAWQTHPVMIVDGGRQDSPAYVDPIITAAQFNQPLPAVPAGAARQPYSEATDLGRVRRFVAESAARAGLPEARADDLITAANELAENTIVHTPGGGVMAMWTEPGTLVCQIDDHGHLADPLAGRIPAPAHIEGGRGLLLAHHLCDLVRIHTTASGTTIRLHMTL
ncbi:sensor histidine kinase [Actinoplanes sp. NEAU-A12]|uniref:Sensor histidine kinase n=1 Tax=Actinoplanes sandaracinus TaxID=3045177 RepID=A0ABT6WRJ6_9ACTN|nr:sensor histidine kinase [Actinoplanes sandaracinus]MDI6102363.1 sensor histidine kinase [Actinoplanes sandaracinus]